VLVAIAPSEVPRLKLATIDGVVLAFNALVAALCAIGFGLLPARRATRMDTYEALRPSATSTATPESGRVRNALVGAEVALCFVVLVATGLLVGSLNRLQRVEPGVREPEQVLTLQLSLPGKRYPDAPKLNAFYEQMLERSAAVPGVVSVGMGMSLPPNLVSITDNYTIEGQAPKDGKSEPPAPLLFVDSGYFATLGIPLMRGRMFTTATRPMRRRS
jgi:hypothetical protein